MMIVKICFDRDCGCSDDYGNFENLCRHDYGPKNYFMCIWCNKFIADFKPEGYIHFMWCRQ